MSPTIVATSSAPTIHTAVKAQHAHDDERARDEHATHVRTYVITLQTISKLRNSTLGEGTKQGRSVAGFPTTSNTCRKQTKVSVLSPVAPRVDCINRLGNRSAVQQTPGGKVLCSLRCGWFGKKQSWHHQQNASCETKRKRESDVACSEQRVLRVDTSGVLIYSGTPTVVAWSYKLCL